MECIYFYKSNIGYFKIVIVEDYIINLHKVTTKEQNHGTSKILTKVIKELDEYFKGERQNFTIPYKLKGTPFQMKVWNELSKIPYGQTRSYKDIAENINCPKGYRAVGLANNKNPIAIIIPCHRVIGINGKLIGYRGGLETKEALLELEQKFSNK